MTEVRAESARILPRIPQCGGFEGQGLGVQGVGFEEWGSGFTIEGFEDEDHAVLDASARKHVWRLGFGATGVVFEVWGVGQEHPTPHFLNFGV